MYVEEAEKGDVLQLGYEEEVDLVLFGKGGDNLSTCTMMTCGSTCGALVE